MRTLLCIKTFTIKHDNDIKDLKWHNMPKRCDVLFITEFCHYMCSVELFCHILPSWFGRWVISCYINCPSHSKKWRNLAGKTDWVKIMWFTARGMSAENQYDFHKVLSVKLSFYHHLYFNMSKFYIRVQ